MLSNLCTKLIKKKISIPKFLNSKEKINTQTTETIIVKDMPDRKKKLFEMGDAFLILPGGSGTIEEATEVISWKFLGLHNKKITA